MKGRASPSGKATQFILTLTAVMPPVNTGGFSTLDVAAPGVETGDVVAITADSTAPFPQQLSLLLPPNVSQDDIEFVFHNLTGANYLGGDTVVIKVLVSKGSALGVP